MSDRSSNVAILHRFLDTLHVTVYNLQKSFSLIRKLKLQATHAFRLMCKHVVNMFSISHGVRAKKVSVI